MDEDGEKINTKEQYLYSQNSTLDGQ